MIAPSVPININTATTRVIFSTVERLRFFFANKIAPFFFARY